MWWSKPVIDQAWLRRQREFSLRTFGPGLRTECILDHIAREMDEVRANPTDITEWADIIILAFAGALRVGVEPQEIIDAIIAKQLCNEQRSWPDWRLIAYDQAIEHDRG